MGRKECGPLRNIEDGSHSPIPKHKALQGSRYRSDPSRPTPDQIQQPSDEVVGSMDRFGAETHDRQPKVRGTG